MDFKDFLFCISILVRGSIREKLDIFFQICSQQGKQFLRKEEFLSFLHSIFSAILKYYQKLQNKLLKQKFEPFAMKIMQLSERIAAEYGSKTYVSINDLILIMNDPVVVEISYLQKKNKSAYRSTCIDLMNSVTNLKRIMNESKLDQFELSEQDLQTAKYYKEQIYPQQQ